MNLCLVIPSLQAGGMERVMSILADEFARKDKVKIHLVLYGKRQTIFYPLAQNIQIHRPSFVFNNTFRLWFTLKTICYMRKEIKRINPDTILSFGEYWNSFVLFSLFGLKYPVFISDRCQPDKKFGRLHSILRKGLYPRASGIISQTNIAREIFHKQKLNNNINVIGNPVRPSNVDLKPIEKENIILSVGRLISSKHHDELIKVFSRIDNSDWKLIIVGDDALKQNNREKLQALIKHLNMEDRVILCGTVSNVEDYYHKSKIFAFTSSSEGFPNVISEAQVAGLPVVAFDCIAGPADLISDGENGYLVPLFDYKLFSKRLQELISDTSLRTELGNRAKQSVKKFAAQSVANEYFKMITTR